MELDCGLIDIKEQQFSNNSDELSIIIYEYFVSGWKDPERRSMLENHYYKQHENLLHYLQKGVENGEFQPNVDLDVINKMMTSYFEGILLHSKAAGAEIVHVKEQLQLFKSFLKEVLQVKDLEGNG
jgi:hypothetical protein